MLLGYIAVAKSHWRASNRDNRILGPSLLAAQSGALTYFAQRPRPRRGGPPIRKKGIYNTVSRKLPNYGCAPDPIALGLRDSAASQSSGQEKVTPRNPGHGGLLQGATLGALSRVAILRSTGTLISGRQRAPPSWPREQRETG